MRLACRLINGDGIGFEYAIVELTPDYAAQLLRLIDEAEKLTKTHKTFCGIEFLDYGAEYGASLGGLETDLPEFGEGRKWIEIPDGFEWPKDSQQSIASLTVVVTKNTIVWRALGAHDYCGPCYETDEMTVEKLRQLFPQQKEQAMEGPESETHRYILYDHDTGDLATATVYDDYEEAVEDAAQIDDVIVLALTFEQQATTCKSHQSATMLSKHPEEAHEEQAATGKCLLCIPVNYDRDATDPEALACAFDHLLETAMSTPGILDEYNNPIIGPIYLGPDIGAADCECQNPGYFHSGVPGIMARVDNGRLAEGAKVERCDSCRRYPSDKAAFDKLVELGMANAPAQQTAAEQYVQNGGGFCPNCRSDQIEGDSVDFDGAHCTQRMRCLECHADWLDVYALSNIHVQD